MWKFLRGTHCRPFSNLLLHMARHDRLYSIRLKKLQDHSCFWELENGEHPTNAMIEEHEKVEEVPYICQSLDKVKEKIEKLH